ncbi:hypothetical protein AX23_00595 [Brucella melitensis 548]|nr:hypothetical protein M798_03910 [Brucella melitensis ADMAS-G1]EXU84973.1 hypothetical protein AX23_00595 [Brucella melitensis 548]
MQGVENAFGLSLVIRYIYYGLRCDKLVILKNHKEMKFILPW